MTKRSLRHFGYIPVLTAFLFALMPLSAQEPKNILENGSFEDGDLGVIWDKKWIPGWPSGGSPDVVELIEDPRTDSPGKKSIKITTTEEISGGGIYSDFNPLDPQKPLKLTGWMKEANITAGPLPYIAICWYDHNKEPIIVKPDTVVNYIYINPYKRQEEWHEVEMNVPVYSEGADIGLVIPKNAAYFQVRLFVGNYIGTIWFDDFVATQD